MSRVLFATDLHLTDGQGGVDAFAADLEQIRALVPDLLVLGGDICLWQQSAGDRMQGLLQDLPFDIMYLMGNHDTDRDGTDTVFDRDFSTRYGSRNSYRQLAETEVIGLNTCRLQPWFDDWRNVRAEVGDSDLAWLDTTLSGLDRTRPLLLFVHIPLATTYPERRGADDDTTDVWRVTNADAVIERFTDWAGPIVVGQGHLHENEHLHEHGMHFVSVGSICGRWWQRGADSRCTDDSPRGWLVVDVEGGDIRLDYQAAGIDAGADFRGEIIAGHGTNRLQLNLFFGDRLETVKIGIDGGWFALPAPEAVPVDDTFFSTHHWTLPADFSGDSLQVRAQLRGRAWEGLVEPRVLSP